MHAEAGKLNKAVNPYRIKHSPIIILFKLIGGNLSLTAPWRAIVPDSIAY